MILSDVNKDVYVPRGPKRVGRGCGSGHGKTSSRGHKGAGSRKSVSRRPGFQGGQKQLFRLVAKRGFNNSAYAAVVVSLNVSQLQAAFARLLSFLSQGLEIAAFQAVIQAIQNFRIDLWREPKSNDVYLHHNWLAQRTHLMG